MTDHKIIKIILGSILILNANCSLQKQSIKELVFNKSVKEFRIENETINEVFFKLTFHDYNMPRILVEFCTEDEPYYKDYKNKIPAKPINIDFKNTTVGEVIKEALRQDPRYTIKEINGYFVIAQKKLTTRKDYILNRRIKHKLMENIRPDVLDFTIIGWFKQQGIDMVFRDMQVWGPVQLVSIDLKNKTLREVLVDLGKFYHGSIFVEVGKDKAYYSICGDRYIKGIDY